MSVSLFNASFYRAVNPDLANFSDAQAQAHFQQWGLNEGRQFSPFVNLNFYRASNADLAGLSSRQLFDHLQAYGVQEERRFSEFVDLNLYRSLHSDLHTFRGEQLFEHLRQWGINEGRQFSTPLDINYYRSLNPDLAAIGFNNLQLLQHFETYGVDEGRISAFGFNSKVYLANNSDLKAAGFSYRQALQHFVAYGYSEGRPGSDYAGNTLSTARNGASTALDFVGAGDNDDFYRFTISSPSTFGASITGLSANASLRLLDSNGGSLQSSTVSGLGLFLNPGTYYLQVSLTSPTQGTNYTLSSSITPQIIGLDLLGAAFDVVQELLNAGDSFDIDFQVRNNPFNSRAASAGAFRVEFYLSTDSTITTSDRLLSFYDVSSLAAGAIFGSPPGQTVRLSLPNATDSIWSGNQTYYVGMVVDSLGAVSEGNENNNASMGLGLDFDAVAITVRPTVTIAAAVPNAAEPGTPGQFTITRTGSTATALTVNYGVGGTATDGVDYSSIATSVTFAAGQSSALIPVNVLDDALVEGNETIVLTLNSSSAYTLGSGMTGTVTILDNDLGNSFNIQFDYRFDTNGWFTDERKAVLEAAATIWESIILDEFVDKPIGTKTPYVIDPQTGNYAGIYVPATKSWEYTTDAIDGVIDDLLIFVGARELGGNTLGRGGSSGNYLNETRYVGSDFEPWMGSLAFDTTINWFFDSTPNPGDVVPPNTNDFLSVAIHEIGHVLGFSDSINAVKTFISNHTFTGANAKLRNGGNAILLQEFDSSGQVDDSHIRNSYTSGTTGESALDPSLTVGTRKLPTVLDIAILNDIGYRVDYSKASQNSPPIP